MIAGAGGEMSATARCSRCRSRELKKSAHARPALYCGSSPIKAEIFPPAGEDTQRQAHQESDQAETRQGKVPTWGYRILRGITKNGSGSAGGGRDCHLALSIASSKRALALRVARLISSAKNQLGKDRPG